MSRVEGPKHYTQEGMDWIADATMSKVLVRNFPDLANSDLANVDNAFRPWVPAQNDGE
jgi:hypothetical protein